MQKKMEKTKSKSRKQNKWKKMQMDTSIFFPFWLSFFSLFFPFYVAFVFLDFADLLFGFSIVFAFVTFFFKF